MTTIRIWLIAAAVCVVIGAAAVDPEFDEVDAAQATADSLNDAQQAAILAAKEP
ncbi:hypothetical protein [Pseudorhodoferax sp. Leaf274]|uniref:hypothetical protein n=1 Tax=Pseudorhodoferax sp. Leaf274 TaxID=1736318 RepID=UPI0012E30015|nr:hypothetical protein [Pseudorhodoferax sp. Leaf274]